jgi:2-oxoglutarate dehydrogenase E2 component (dihydrolipoamide succinyltransferase)
VVSEIIVPRLNNNDASYILVEWLFSDGQHVPSGSAVATVETAKALEEIVVDAEGVLHRAVDEGAECAPLEVIGRLLDGDRRPEAPGNDAGNGAGVGGPALTITEPAAEFIRDNGLVESDLWRLGKSLVTRADVETLVASGHRGDKIVTLSRNQRAVAATVAESHRTIPQAFAQIRVRGSALAEQRKAVRVGTGRVFGALELLVLAVGDLAAEYPLLYARVRDAETVVVPDAATVNVGVTADSGHGLFIPVLRAVPEKSLDDVVAELDSFRRKSATGDFRARELTGANISVSVANYTDLTCSVPFVQPGQVCMLSLCGTQHETDAGTNRRVPYFTVGLSYDHRVVNGRLAARFLKSVKRVFEDPHRIAELCGTHKH